MSYQVKYIFKSALLCGVFVVASSAAHATSYKWVGPNNGEWNNAANWLPQGIPGADDDAAIGGKKKVSVPRNITVANLFVGAGTEIKNGGGMKVTGQTKSAGLFTGLGTLDVPEGGSASFNVDASSELATPSGNTDPAVVFAPINNKGRIYTRVAKGCRVDFAAIKNEGVTQIVSEGIATFKDIRNAQRLAIRATGTLTLAKIDNASDASLYIYAPTITPVITKVTTQAKGKDKDKDTEDPSVVHLDALTNRRGGKVQLVGSGGGRYFNGKSITNAGDMQLKGALTLLDGDVTNAAGATLTLASNSTVFPADKKVPKLKNSGKIIKAAGSDATLHVEWVNEGQVVVQRGTLHVSVPQKKGFVQSGGITTLQGGTLSVEQGTQAGKKGTFEVVGGIVNGIGTIEGDVVNSLGTFKPGNSPGTITINGNFTQTAGGVLNMEVGGTTPGTGYDQILVNGTAYLGGTLNLVRWNNYVPKNGDVYSLFTYYAKVGNFAQFVDASPVSGISYNTTLTPTDYEVNCYWADLTPPVVSIANPLDGRAVRSLLLASGRASDASGIKNVTCQLSRYANTLTGVTAGYWAGGTSWSATAIAATELPALGTTSWTFAVPVLVPGRYSLRATGTDMAGNKAYSRTISFWVDPVAPSVLTVDTPANGATIASLTSLGGAVSDTADGSGIVAVQGLLRRLSDGLYWNGTSWSLTAPAFNATLSGGRWARSTGLPLGANLKAGKYSVSVVATDRAGNKKSTITTFTVGAAATSSVQSS